MVHRRGFTWLELVFCVMFIGMLLMLIVPLFGSRGHIVHRQVYCMNNMAVNLAKAHLQYATVNGRFCGYVNSVGSDKKCVSWVVPLFTYIDRKDLEHAWITADYEWEDANHTIPARIKHPHTYIELLVCPTNPPADEKSSPLSYVVNGGYAGDVQPQCADAECTTLKPGTGENLANGVFHDQYEANAANGFSPQIARSVTFQYLAAHDGASRTLMLSENVQWATTWYTTTEDRAPLAFVWFQTSSEPGDSESAARRINSLKMQPTGGRLDFVRPSSYHAQGVNVAFCDGHGKFISESIDYRVYKQLLTSASADSDDADPLEVCFKASVRNRGGGVAQPCKVVPGKGRGTRT